jgi:hypothetical protein
MPKCANPLCQRDAAGAQFLCVMCWAKVPSNQRIAFAAHKNALINAGENVMQSLNAPGKIDVEVVVR